MQRLIALCVLLVFTGCSNDLSRGKAKGLLEESGRIKNAKEYVRIQVGNRFDYQFYPEKYDLLAKQGHLVIEPRTISLVHLPEGSEPGGLGLYGIPTARGKEVVEITGIERGDLDKSQAQVEYSWRWKPTPLGETYLKAGLTLTGMKTTGDFNKPQKGKAYFKLFDDGWRVNDNF